MAATGFFSLPKSEIRDMIADTAAFQTFTGTANATDAKAYIHIYEDEPPSGQTAYCLIDDHPEAGRFSRSAVGAGISSFRWTRGSVFGIYQHVASFGETTAEAFDNAVSDILTQILDRSGVDPFRYVDEIIALADPESGGLLQKYTLDDGDGTIAYVYARYFQEQYRLD